MQIARLYCCTTTRLSAPWHRLKHGYRTMSFWRWGIQAMVCVALTCPLVTISPIDEFFQKTSVWAVQSSLVVLEATTGASVKKSVERIVGTVVGGMMTFGFLHLTMGSNQLLNTTMTKIINLIYVILIPLFWGWIRVKFPNNLPVAVYGILTTYLVVVTHYLGQSAFQLTILRIIAVVIGVLVNTIVVHSVVPNSARLVLKRTMVDVFNNTANMLEPLLELELGVEQTSDILNPNKIILKDIATQRQRLVEMKRRHMQKKEENAAALPLSPQSIEKSSEESCLNKSSNKFGKQETELFLTRISIDMQPKQLITDLSGLNSEMSFGSAYFREQETRLEELRGETLRKLVTNYAMHLKYTESQRQEKWKEVLKTFEKCQTLLASLGPLIIAAKQEVHCGREPAIFPSKQYSKLLSHVQRLFHNIASLVFSLDLQKAQISRAKREAFMAFGTGRGKDGNAPGAIEDPESAHRIFARIAGAFLYTDIFGTIVTQAAANIRQALFIMGKCIADRHSTIEALKAIEAAAADIWLLGSVRTERSKIYSKIFAAGLKADYMGRWMKKNDKQIMSLPWEKLMGLDASTLRFMSKAEYQAYWESHWVARDRLSVVTGTLLLLRDQLFVIGGVIDELIIQPADDREFLDNDSSCPVREFRSVPPQ